MLLVKVDTPIVCNRHWRLIVHSAGQCHKQIRSDQQVSPLVADSMWPDVIAHLQVANLLPILGISDSNPKEESYIDGAEASNIQRPDSVITLCEEDC